MERQRKDDEAFGKVRGVLGGSGYRVSEGVAYEGSSRCRVEAFSSNGDGSRLLREDVHALLRTGWVGRGRVSLRKAELARQSMVRAEAMVSVQASYHCNPNRKPPE